MQRIKNKKKLLEKENSTGTNGNTSVDIKKLKTVS